MRRMLTTAVAVIFGLSVLFLGCGGVGSADADGAVVDDAGAVADAGTPDAGGADAGSPDTCGDTSAEDCAGRVLTRLRADGLDIVNAAGEKVVLRGVNLGGWLFLETWIPMIDYSTLGRARAFGERAGIAADVDAAIVEVGTAGDFGMEFCPGNNGGWIDLFQMALAERLGDEGATAFVDDVKRYPSLCTDSDYTLRVLLQQRFGAAGRDELMDIFQRAWITEDDIKWIADQGFSLARLPIGYRDLITAEESMKPAALPWNEMAFARLADVLGWCKKHGLYAVLDIQEAPGGQNDYAGEATLYTDPAMQALTVQLWEELSARFKDLDQIAAYSLLAEPFKAPDANARDRMYDQIVKAVRAKGDDHLLVIHDGFFGMVTMPLPPTYGWENVVYSTHLFEGDLKSAVAYEKRIEYYDATFPDAQKAQGVPYYIGSFAVPNDEPWTGEAIGLLVDWYEKRHWSWSIWTYKRVEDPLEIDLLGIHSNWGVRGRLTSVYDQPDVYLDDIETLKAKLAAYKGVVVDPAPAVLDALKARLPKK